MLPKRGRGRPSRVDQLARQAFALLPPAAPAADPAEPEVAAEAAFEPAVDYSLSVVPQEEYRSFTTQPVKCIPISARTFSVLQIMRIQICHSSILA